MGLSRNDGRFVSDYATQSVITSLTVFINLPAGMQLQLKRQARDSRKTVHL
ncbi:MAG: hypothetical protein ABJG88_12430 [Litorimonas sp.]